MHRKYSFLEKSYCGDDDLPLSSQVSGSSWAFTSLRERNGVVVTAPFLRYLTFARNTFIYLLALCGFFNIVRQLPTRYRDHSMTALPRNHEMRGCDCGNSVAEAVSIGCKFDALSMAWLPEHCRDDELTAEFETTGKGPNGTWIYYEDTEHTVVIEADEVAAMGDDSSRRVHMDKDWHQTHCFFYWLKLHRTRSTGKMIEPRSDTEAHIRHCGMVFRKPGYGTISGVALNTNEAAEE